MRLPRVTFIAILIVATAQPALPELTISQGLASWSSNETTAVRKTPILTVVAPITASNDPARVEFAEIVCFAFASRDAGERNVRGARGRYTTYAYTIDEATRTVEKIVLDSGEIKTAKNGRASWTTHIPTASVASSLKSEDGSMWSLSELTWTNSRKVEFTLLGCFLLDEENLDQGSY
ncbi:MAG: hypothetical protein OEM62_03875 [Acidobacteriota bacterium]|nr:hypothetical protein [Acidobacteriota bacterium]